MWFPYGSTQKHELSQASRLRSESYGTHACSLLGPLPHAHSWRAPNHMLSSGTPSLSSSSVQMFPLSQWLGLPVLARESENNCEKLDQNHKREQYLVPNAFRSFWCRKGCWKGILSGMFWNVGFEVKSGFAACCTCPEAIFAITIINHHQLSTVWSPASSPPALSWPPSQLWAMANKGLAKDEQGSVPGDWHRGGVLRIGGWVPRISPFSTEKMEDAHQKHRSLNFYPHYYLTPGGDWGQVATAMSSHTT